MYDMEEAFEFIEENKDHMTWKEIRDELNKKFGLNYSESAYRKPYDAFAKGVEFAMNLAYPLKQLDLIAKRRARLKIEQKILQKERYVINQELNTVATHKLFNDVVLNKIKETSPKIPKMKLEKEGDKYYVLTLADLHYTGYEDLEYILAEVKEKVLEKKKLLGFSKLVIAELGDIIEGASLRPSQLLAIKKGMIDQTLDVAKIYSKFLNELSKEVQIDFKCVESSNHTQLRNQKTQRNELPAEDTMKVFVEYVKAATSNSKNITIESAPELITKINGKTFAFVHGHNMTKKPIADLNKEYDVDIDYLVHGHWHHTDIRTHSRKGYNNRMIIGVSSMKVIRGDYEKNNHMSAMPSIGLIEFDKKEGYKYMNELYLTKSLKKHEVKEKVKKKVR